MRSFKESALLAAGHIRTSPLRALIWFQTINATDLIYRPNLLPERGSLPKPIDIKDHFGNLPDSVLFSGLGALVFGAFVRLSALPSTVRKITLVGGLLTAMVANAISETKLGQRLFHIQEMGNGTPAYVPNQDIIDFIWGTAAGVGAATIITKAERHEFVDRILRDRYIFPVRRGRFSR